MDVEMYHTTQLKINNIKAVSCEFFYHYITTLLHH